MLLLLTSHTLQSSYRDFLSDESTLLGQRQHQKEPTSHRYPTAKASNSSSRLSPLHEDLCRQTLLYCQKKEQREEWWSHVRGPGQSHVLELPTHPMLVQQTGLKKHNCRRLCSVRGSWTRWALRVPSNSNKSMILLLSAAQSISHQNVSGALWRTALWAHKYLHGTAHLVHQSRRDIQGRCSPVSHLTSVPEVGEAHFVPVAPGPASLPPHAHPS